MAIIKRTRTRREILESSERKRARTTEEKQRNLRGITIVKEKVQGLRVRLFKWNESLLRDKFSDRGVIVTKVKNFNADDDGCGVAENGDGMLEQQVGLFPLEYLQRGWEDEMRSLVVTALKVKEVFAEEDTVGDLAEEVVSYISSNFRFTRHSLTCSRTRRIVVLIEVDMVTTREYCVIKEDNNIEEEDSHQLDHQPLEDNDQSENHPVEESDTEEEYGYDDRLDQPFSTFHLANTHLNLLLLLLEEEEEEEEEEEGSSEPELAEIEDILWRFHNNSEHVSRADPDRSRDCRGLKQVKEAIEIIKKELCSKDKETDPCPLCLEELAEGEEAVARTRCSHLFHRNCLRSWLSIKDSCPLCRSRCATKAIQIKCNASCVLCVSRSLLKEKKQQLQEQGALICSIENAYARGFPEKIVAPYADQDVLLWSEIVLRCKGSMVVVSESLTLMLQTLYKTDEM